MAEDRGVTKARVTDWLILVFVLAVMALLAIELGTNLRSTGLWAAW